MLPSINRTREQNSLTYFFLNLKEKKSKRHYFFLLFFKLIIFSNQLWMWKLQKNIVFDSPNLFLIYVYIDLQLKRNRFNLWQGYGGGGKLEYIVLIDLLVDLSWDPPQANRNLSLVNICLWGGGELTIKNFFFSDVSIKRDSFP